MTTLFSAHMAQHMLLDFCRAAALADRHTGLVNPAPGPGTLLALLITHPVIAFTIFNGVMWVWHIPAAYDAALANQQLHIIEHLTVYGVGGHRLVAGARA